MEVPGTAVPTTGPEDEPPSLSAAVIPRVAWGLKVSESVAVTVEASEALAVAVLTRVPVAEERMAATTV